MSSDYLEAPSWGSWLAARILVGLDYYVYLLTMGPIRKLFRRPPKETLPVMVSPPTSSMHTGVWRSRKGEKQLLEGPEWAPEANDLYTLFLSSARAFPEANCFAWRPVVGELDVGERFPAKVFGPTKYQTYSSALEDVSAFAKAIRLVGCSPQPPPGDFHASTGPHSIVLYSPSCREWTLSCLGAHAAGMTVATVFATLGLSAVQTAVEESGSIAMLCGHSAVLDALKTVKGIKILIWASDNGAEDPQPDSRWDTVAKENEIKIYSFKDFLAIPASSTEYTSSDQTSSPASPSDSTGSPISKLHFAVVMYTSGSTGRPKGVMLRHGNILSMIAMGPVMLGSRLSGLSHLSYLPSAHVFELLVQLLFLSHGNCVCFADPKSLSDTLSRPHGALKEFRPQILCGVPKIWDVFMKAAQAKIATLPPSKRYITNYCIQAKIHRKEKGGDTILLDALIFKKIAAALGGRAKVALSGGGPTANECFKFCAAAFCVDLFQGYGLTETAASATMEPIQDGRPGVAGYPTGCIELRLRSCVKSCGLCEGVCDKCEAEVLDRVGKRYLATDRMDALGRTVLGRGEVQLRGPAVAAGYFKNPKMTASAWDSEGWFSTGDVGLLLADGCLEIVDRVKNLVKLHTGEYVALEHMELCYGQSSLIDPISGGICCYADGEMDRPVGLIQVNQKELLKRMASEGIPKDGDYLVDSRVRKMVLAEMDKQWKRGGLSSIERIAAVALLSEPWTAESGNLTATNKISRHGIARNFEEVIAGLKKEVAGNKGSK